MEGAYLKLENKLATLINYVKEKDPGEKEFQQATTEILESILPYIKDHPEFARDNLLERLLEPERVITFRVPWVDDQGGVHVNRGWRVEFNSALGPYKGGIRFTSDTTLDTMKFLAFEQTFKNALTTLPLGGGKGGADFDTRERSDMEIMRFCQSYITELYRHIGEKTDVPAGDLGVGAREVGYMFGQYKRLKNEFTGTFTGKGLSFGGSLLRPEATGYGVGYFVEKMLARQNKSIVGKRVSISGYGNVGAPLIEKINQLGGIVVTASDADGYIYDPDGIKGEKLAYIKDLWTVHRLPIKEYAKRFDVKYVQGKRPWEVPVDIAIPSSRQNELDKSDAETLVKNGVICVCEASNMGLTADAAHYLHDEHISFAPGKAANAGGVSVSGFEMAQNSTHTSWTSEEVDQKLKQVMQRIHDKCVEYGTEGTKVDYVKGANIAGFIKIAEAMLAQGVV